MITLRDFRTTMLGPLLRGDPVTDEMPLFLFAARLDDPLRYVFESDRWDEIAGAARRLATARDRLRQVLAADGFTADDLLHCDDSGVLALVPDRDMAERWIESMERAVAAETDLVTVSSVVYPITAAQLLGGLYGTPRAVLGVPGVHDYQERVNRYYGLSSPSTVPREDAVLQRRHFGEVVALMDTLLVRARESRTIVPFYESLPFAERCDSCRVRPAEQVKEGDIPVCGVCLRKRAASPGTQLTRAGLIWIEAANLDRVLEQQRTPASYRRLYQDIDETLHIAIPGRRSVTLLAAGGGWMALAAHAPEALEVATETLEAISLHYGLKLPAAFIAAVALGPFARLDDLLQQITLQVRRAVDGTTCLLDVRTLPPDGDLSGTIDRLRKPYTIDEARRLLVGLSILRDVSLPENLLAEMPEQAARGSAGLYYLFERSKLPEADQQILKRLEHAWDAGAAPGPRFYTMLADALALARHTD